MRKSVGVKLAAICVLCIVCAVVWDAVIASSTGGQLTVSFLSVGQGDAIFVRAPSGVTALIDGGPDAGVLRSLGEVEPWYEHSIDLVVASSPAQTHTGGLPDILSRYSVPIFMQSSTGGTGQWYGLEKTLQQKHEQGMQLDIAQRGDVIDLGGGAYLQVLFPDRSLPEVDAASGCIVMRLAYGTTSFMLPCDAPQSLEKYLVALDGARLRSDVLLVGSNGSKNSTSALFVGDVAPTYAVVSRACDPKDAVASSTLDTLQQFGVQVFDTCKSGTITFISDGATVSRR